MPELNVTVTDGLWRALQNFAAAKREPVAEIVAQALSDYLQISHSTLYQVSTSSALVEGVYRGAVTVKTLREHGDHGLGTFDQLDGEMIVVDGRFFQVRSDGSVRECEDDALTPFAVITHFVPEPATRVSECRDFEQLCAHFEGLRTSDNLFYALRVDGRFDTIRTRAMCRTAEGVPLVQAAAHQPEFEFHDITGTLIGFWSPDYAKTLNVPGYHLHFISDDRARGGHVLQCSGTDLQLQIEGSGDFRVVLPTNVDFLHADLHRDPSADLERAEREQR
jgi:acetolactate decarboxylase